MAASFQIGAIAEYKEGQEDFESYRERLEMWMIANSVAVDKKVSVFLSVIGADTYRLLKNLVSPDKPSTRTYEQLCDALGDHYKPKPLVIVERFRFQKRNQHDGESNADYIVALKQLSTHCDFGAHLNDALRDRFVSGLKSEDVQRRLLSRTGLTFKTACEMALAMEMASRNAQEFSGHMKDTGTVNKVHLEQNKGGWKPRSSSAQQSFRPAPTNYDGRQQQQEKPCYRCGGKHAAQLCRFKQEKCHHCFKIGHISRMCRNKQTHYVEQEAHEYDDDEENAMLGVRSVFTASSNKRGIKVHVKLEGKGLDMLLDTGADATLVSEVFYEECLSHLPLEECFQRLSTFTGERIPTLGQVNVNARYEQQTAKLPLVIVKGDRPALLGRDWLDTIRLNWGEIFAVKAAGGVSVPGVEAVLQRHKAVFGEGPSIIKEFKASIRVKSDAQPICRKARPVPYSLREPVEKELDRLEAMGIISKTDRSEWASPIVIVPKADKSIRICGDYKVTINQSVEEETYPLPNTEDLFATLAGGKLFTKLDLSHAYQQLQLDKDSEKYLTVNTHRGLYVYHRLAYGVSSAPSIFQGVMDQILQGLDHVTCFLDDILITAGSEKEHLKKLDEVLSRLEKYGVRVKRAKCKFMESRVEYLGHIVDSEGLHPTDEKVEALVRAPSPTNVSELRSFLGLLNYYGRFLKGLSTLLQPLHALLKKESPWKWTPECEDAFTKTKRLLLKSKVVVHYDTRKPVRLACDASPYGVGAVISHIMEDGKEKPIAFASRTLSEAESKYAQIEKEALSIIFGVRKFHKYLYGRKFILTTDHKPLLAILGPKSAIPTLAALRMQRWALILMAYTYDIEYRKSADHANADAFSRLPRPDKDKTAEENGIFYFSVVDDLPVHASDIAHSTCKDPVLSKVREFILNGWPHHIDGEALRPFFIRRTELSEEQGCVLWGMRVIVPPAHRTKLLSDLHTGHPGICRMKALARSYVWWPHLDSDIEETVQSCGACQSVRKLPAVAPLHCWKWPERVWQRVHIDFFEKDKRYFLVLVDSHSKWLEVVPMKTTTSAKTIDVLRNLFASHGLPEEVVSDNGPQFTSCEFKQFLRSNGIKQTLVPAYHPASNGAAEKSVQTVKAALLKQVLGEEAQQLTMSLQHRLANFLLMYRSTPHSVTGVSPAELFLKRQLRTRFSLLKPSLARTVEEKQLKQKIHHDKATTKLRRLSPGDSVRVRNFREGKEKWFRATVTKRLGPVTYLINDGCRERSVHIDHLLLSREAELQYPNSSDHTTTARDFNEPFTSQVSTQPQGTRESTPGPTHTPRTTPGTPARTPASSDSPAQPPQSPTQPTQSPTAPVNSSSPAMRRYPERVRMKPERYKE